MIRDERSEIALRKQLERKEIEIDALWSVVASKDDEICELWKTIDFLNAKIEAAVPSPEITNIRYACIELIRTEGKFIPAIKKYREATGASLKDAVDRMRIIREEIVNGKYGDFHPSLTARKPWG